MTFFSCNVLNVNSLKYVSMNNQECKIRPEITSLNTNEPLFSPYSIKMNKCKSSCNKINDLYYNMCVAHKIRNTMSKYLI